MLSNAIILPVHKPFAGDSINRPRTFGRKDGVPVNTLITSRKCYPRLPGLMLLDDLEMLNSLEMHETLNRYSTVEVVGGEGTMPDVEYTLNGGLSWTAAPGVWGHARFIQVRGASSNEVSTTLSALIRIDSYDYLFFVTTAPAGPPS